MHFLYEFFEVLVEKIVIFINYESIINFFVIKRRLFTNMENSRLNNSFFLYIYVSWRI